MSTVDISLHRVQVANSFLQQVLSPVHVQNCSGRSEMLRPCRTTDSSLSFQAGRSSTTIASPLPLIVSPSKQAVQAGRPSTTIAERSSMPCRFHFRQAVQHYFLRCHCLSCSCCDLRQHWRLFRLDTEAAQPL